MRRALIISSDNFEDMELFYPFYRLQEDGWEVDVAGPATGTIVGKHGYEYTTTIAFKDVRPERYSLLIIPGGKAPESVRLHEHALKITRYFFDKRIPIGAICHGPQVLISAGLLSGRKVTCWQGIKDDVMAAGAQYRDCEVAEDHNLVTSRSPSDLPAFMRQIRILVETPDLKKVAGI
jgi:protease I